MEAVKASETVVEGDQFQSCGSGKGGEASVLPAVRRDVGPGSVLRETRIEAGRLWVPRETRVALKAGHNLPRLGVGADGIPHDGAVGEQPEQGKLSEAA